MIADYKPATGYGWYLTDHLGSTRRYALSDEGESHMRVNYYYPYGDMPAGARTVSGDEHAETPYQFSQKRLDNGIGLYYFGSRYYDPSIGRWYVPDPAGQGWSPYAYCGNLPVMMVDPDGEFPFFVPILVGAIWGGGNAIAQGGNIGDVIKDDPVKSPQHSFKSQYIVYQYRSFIYIL